MCASATTPRSSRRSPSRSRSSGSSGCAPSSARPPASPRTGAAPRTRTTRAAATGPAPGRPAPSPTRRTSSGDTVSAAPSVRPHRDQQVERALSPAYRSPNSFLLLLPLFRPSVSRIPSFATLAARRKHASFYVCRALARSRNFGR